MEQRSEEWFAARIGRVTGSQVGAILGLSPYADRASVMRSMVRAYHKSPTEFTGNVATGWGTAMEPQARADYEMDTCQDVQDAGFVEWEDWLGASPDGFVGKDGLVEFKCPYGIRNDAKPVFKSLFEQEHYHAQVQVQLYVTNRQWCHFYQWTPTGQSLSLVQIDKEWLNANIPVLRQFHEEYLSEIDNTDHLEALRIDIDTPAAHKMVAEYDQLGEAIALAEERKKELLQEIVTLAGERDAIVAGRKVTKVDRAGSVSYAKVVKEKLPKLDLSPWTGKATSYWKLT